MRRYPDKIVVYKVSGDTNNPYEEPTYELVYEGRCRVFFEGTSGGGKEEATDSDYRAIIPDSRMVDVGENYKVCLKRFNSSKDKVWDVIGYCKNFARYDRVCEVYVQMTKNNIIEEDTSLEE